MATRVLPFACTIPPGTPASAPVTIPLPMDNWVVEAIELEVPPGPAGLMGFQIFNNGVPWLPYGAQSWFVWDDNSETYYLEEQPTASGWALVGYNTGTFPHTVTVRVHVSPTSANQGATPAPSVTFNTTAAPTAEPVILG